MNLLTADAETFWAIDYSVKEMGTEPYVRDLRFQEILWGLKWNDTLAFWIGPDRFRAWVKEVDWSQVMLVCHHSHFDGFILSHHHGTKPGLHIDTLSMARVLDGPKAGNSLDQLATRHGVGQKGFATQWSKGKRLADFTPDEYARYGEYCVNDVEITHRLAQKFLPQLPAEEIRLIDLTVRMFTEPVFQGDTAKLAGAVTSERERKIALLRRIGQLCGRCGGSGIDIMGELVFDGSDKPLQCKDCDGTGVNKKVIGSNEAFADLLRSFDVEPEKKPSPSVKNEDGTPAMNYAFAKTDPFIQSLLEDEDEDVRFLAEARVAVKSTIVETRAQRFHDCASRGPMPVYVAPFGAHTFRSAGGDSMNWLNVTSKFNANRPEMSVIAASIQAPPGYKIVTADSAQGEARLVGWQAGQADLVKSFADGHDVYSEFASTVYGRPVDRKKKVNGVAVDHIPGQVGKIGILQLGFGAGWLNVAGQLLKGILGNPPIQFTEADMVNLHVDPSRFLNNPRKIAQVDAMPSRLELTDRLIHCAVSEALVLRYRARYPAIPKWWEFLETIITAMIRGEEVAFGPGGCMRTDKECIWMPNGLPLRYRGLERDSDGQATYFNGRNRTKIYGGLLCENLTQCLHYIIVSRQMLEIAEELRVVLSTYDDVAAAVPEGEAELALRFMVGVMGKSPEWAVGLPLLGEGKSGSTLLEAS